MDKNEITRRLLDAAEAGNIEQVSLLLGKSKERLNELTPFGTWLHVAAEAGKLELIQWLISRGADINASGGAFGGAPINVAAGYGQLEAVKALLAAGAEMDVREPDCNPLFAAIQDGHFEVVKLLIDRGIDYRIRYTGDSMKDMDAQAFAREQGQTEIANYLGSLTKGGK